MGHAKAQVASLDIVIAVTVLLFFIAIIVILFPSKPRDSAIYSSKAFWGIENAPSAYAFLSGYVVDETKLGNFASLGKEQMEAVVLNSTEYTGFTSDICIFFLNSGGLMDINGAQTMGIVYLDDSHSSSGLCSFSDPCQHYKQTAVYTRPVARNDEIINMHVVVCS